jgi:sterol desaturase/sphingolipid hydroxylase (fatty acid hydroxylase superfamily)
MWLLLLALERLAPDRTQAPTWRDPQLWNDLGHNAVGQGIAGAIGEGLVLILLAWLAGRGDWANGPWPADAPYAAQALVVVFIADGIEYARHRASHTVSWLWPIHALHHSSDRMHVLKGGRTHLLDIVGRYVVVYVPLAALGVPVSVLAVYTAATSLFGPVAHSNVAVRLPGFLHRVVMTPGVHRIHHARPLALSCSNYANVFPIWDVLFGTFEDPDRHPAPEYGIEGEAFPSGFAAQLFYPLRDWWLKARAALATRSFAPPRGAAAP